MGDVEHTNFVSAGQVLGEMGTLTGATRSAAMVCETSVQAFFIPTDKINSVLIQYPLLGNRLWRVCGT